MLVGTPVVTDEVKTVLEAQVRHAYLTEILRSRIRSQWLNFGVIEFYYRKQDILLPLSGERALGLCIANVNVPEPEHQHKGLWKVLISSLIFAMGDFSGNFKILEVENVLPSTQNFQGWFEKNHWYRKPSFSGADLAYTYQWVLDSERRTQLTLKEPTCQ